MLTILLLICAAIAVRRAAGGNVALAQWNENVKLNRLRRRLFWDQHIVIEGETEADRSQRRPW